MKRGLVLLALGLLLIGPILAVASSPRWTAVSSMLMFMSSGAPSEVSDTNPLPVSSKLCDAAGTCITFDPSYGVPVTLMTVASIQGYNRTASGALGALNNAVTIDATGAGTIAYEIDTGTLSTPTSTVIAECTLDDTTYDPVYMIDFDGKTYSRHTAFGVHGYLKIGASYSKCRLRVSVYNSGTSNARLAASPASIGIRPDSVSCMDSFAVSKATGDSTTAVAGVTGERVYVCGWDIVADGTTNVSLVYGNDANCATSQVALTGAYPLTAQAGRAGWASGGIVVRTPPDKFLCVKSSAAQQIEGVISYSRH